MIFCRNQGFTQPAVKPLSRVLEAVVLMLQHTCPYVPVGWILVFLLSILFRWLYNSKESMEVNASVCECSSRLLVDQVQASLSLCAFEMELRDVNRYDVLSVYCVSCINIINAGLLCKEFCYIVFCFLWLENDEAKKICGKCTLEFVYNEEITISNHCGLLL